VEILACSKQNGEVCGLQNVMFYLLHEIYEIILPEFGQYLEISISTSTIL
jgi:hypothetical protein